MELVLQNYLKEQKCRHDLRELRRVVRELRETQVEVAPMIAKANELRRKRRRMDGPSGFVMVEK